RINSLDKVNKLFKFGNSDEWQPRKAAESDNAPPSSVLRSKFTFLTDQGSKPWSKCFSEPPEKSGKALSGNALQTELGALGVQLRGFAVTLLALTQSCPRCDAALACWFGRACDCSSAAAARLQVVLRHLFRDSQLCLCSVWLTKKATRCGGQAMRVRSPSAMAATPPVRHPSSTVGAAGGHLKTGLSGVDSRRFADSPPPRTALGAPGNAEASLTSSNEY
uniref:Phorbol-ester/DAG-type domain-containing protein n=1 Tax=Macrostomum lignano TaxID=282301 RepID=A0A1I8FJB8_9PLAT